MRTDIKQLLESASNIAVFGHVNPDGDCVGSMLGLGGLLEKMGKTVSYFTPTLPSSIYDFLSGIHKISSDFDYANYDLLVFLDFSDFGRINSFYQNNLDYFNNHKTVVIDHHIYKDIHENWTVISDKTSMSACELIFEYANQRRPDLFDENIATYLYLGLTTDSGNFRYDQDHKRILTNALRLVELGADKKYIVNNAFRKKSFAGVKMMELMFKRLQKKGNLIYTWYTNNDIKRLGIDREEADFGQIIVQDIAEADVSIIFRNDEKNQKMRISLRSKEIDVQKIAQFFGGGGHIHAAGCSQPRKGLFSKQVDLLSTKISSMIG